MKKVFLCLVAVLLLVGCSPGGNQTATGGDGAGEAEQSVYKTLTIQTNLTNPEAKDDYYLVYLLTPGQKATEAGEATQGGYYGPFPTDAEGKVVIELEYNLDIARLIEDEASTKKKHLQLIVATQEDIYLRNPLNQETYIEFAEPSDDSDGYDYYSTVESLTVDITDKYPDGVLSLTFPDATFVIKLVFDEAPVEAYEVNIYKPSDTAPDGIGSYRIGRICREFQYWDTPFFKDDCLEEWSGTIVVNACDTNERILYEGYPLRVTFGANGKCEQGDIVTVKMPQ